MTIFTVIITIALIGLKISQVVTANAAIGMDRMSEPEGAAAIMLASSGSSSVLQSGDIM